MVFFNTSTTQINGRRFHDNLRKGGACMPLCCATIQVTAAHRPHNLQFDNGKVPSKVASPFFGSFI
ncbi:hypothetical protein OAM67_00590 [bacterium]|nr:hypothetical protein [bacterium]